MMLGVVISWKRIGETKLRNPPLYVHICPFCENLTDQDVIAGSVFYEEIGQD